MKSAIEFYASRLVLGYRAKIEAPLGTEELWTVYWSFPEEESFPQAK